MEKHRNHYSREFKQKAVELSIQKGNLAGVARELGVRPDTLTGWRQDYRKGKFEDTPSVKTRTKEEEELVRLRKELREVQLERDILKKAVSIFSKSDR